jgi:hypothetical protein
VRQRNYYYYNKERYIKHVKKWRKKNVDKCREYVKKCARLRRRKPEIFLKEKAYLEQYRLNNPLKIKAGDRIRDMVRSGKIKKPYKCELCSKKGLVHGHHEDYNKPLEVIWLCPVCHASCHKKNHNTGEGVTCNT